MLRWILLGGMLAGVVWILWSAGMCLRILGKYKGQRPEAIMPLLQQKLSTAVIGVLILVASLFLYYILV